MHEIGKMLGKKPGVFQRTLNRLAEEGLLRSEYRAHARYFQVNIKYPLYSEIKKIIAKTVGVEGTLRELLGRIKNIKLAVLYGSFAKGKERQNSDIDLLIVGNSGVEDQLMKELPRLEKQLQREVNYKLYSKTEYQQKKSQDDPFLHEVLTDQKIVLKGNPDAI